MTTFPSERLHYNPGIPIGNQNPYQGHHGVLTDLQNPAITKAYNVLTPGSDTHYGFFYKESVNANGPDVSTIYLWLPIGVNPNTKVTEVSVGRATLEVGSDFNISGISFRHSNTSAWGIVGVASVQAGERSHIDNCDIQYSDFSGAFVGQRGTITNTKIAWSGNNGYQLSRYGRISGCHISRCNYRNYNLGWASGGGKHTSLHLSPNDGAHGITIENCEFTGNWGPSIWFDYVDEHNAPVNMIRGNYIHDNVAYSREELVGGVGPSTQVTRTMAILAIEASNGFMIYNNIIAGNSTYPISLAAAEDCQVFDNLIIRNDSNWKGDGSVDPWECVLAGQNGYLTYHNPDGTAISGTPSVLKPLRNNRIYNNVFYDNRNALRILSVQANEATRTVSFDNYVDYNTYASADPASFRWGGLPSPYSHATFQEWKAGSGWDVNSKVLGLSEIQFLAAANLSQTPVNLIRQAQVAAGSSELATSIAAAATAATNAASAATSATTAATNASTSATNASLAATSATTAATNASISATNATTTANAANALATSVNTAIGTRPSGITASLWNYAAGLDTALDAVENVTNGPGVKTVMLKGASTTSAQAELTTDGAAPSATNRVKFEPGKTYSVLFQIVGRGPASGGAKSVSWARFTAFRNVGGAITELPAVTANQFGGVKDTAASTYAYTVTKQDNLTGDDFLKVTATAGATETVNWVARLQIIETAN